MKVCCDRNADNMACDCKPEPFVIDTTQEISIYGAIKITREAAPNMEKFSISYKDNSGVSILLNREALKDIRTLLNVKAKRWGLE